MVWEPYTSELLAQLPDYCLQGRAVWRARVPLICFHIVELHLPDRVMRQFGMVQDIPRPCDTDQTLHAADRRGRFGEDWSLVHRDQLDMWDRRGELVVTGTSPARRMTYMDPYMVWFRRITRRYIVPPTPTSDSTGFQPVAGERAVMVEALTRAYRAAVVGAASTDPAQKDRVLASIQHICWNALSDTAPIGIVDEDPPDPSQRPAVDPVPPPRPARRFPMSRRRRPSDSQGPAGVGSSSIPPPSTTTEDTPVETATPYPTGAEPDIAQSESGRSETWSLVLTVPEPGPSVVTTDPSPSLPEPSTQVALGAVVEVEGGPSQAVEDDPQIVIRRPRSQLPRRPRAVEEATQEPSQVVEPTGQTEVVQTHVYRRQRRKPPTDVRHEPEGRDHPRRQIRRPRCGT